MILAKKVKRATKVTPVKLGHKANKVYRVNRAFKGQLAPRVIPERKGLKVTRVILVQPAHRVRQVPRGNRVFQALSALSALKVRIMS